MAQDDFNRMVAKFTEIPGRISAKTSSEFETQFRDLLDKKEAKEKNIVYLWLADRPIPRLKGESRVIYIGKTINSMRDRHYGWAKIESEGNNWLRYNFIITNFGPITFMVTPCTTFASNPAFAEIELFKGYFESHLEAPPLNRQISFGY